MDEPRLIVAADYDSLEDALELADQLNPRLCRLKVGHQLYSAAGPQAVRQLQDKGYDVFLDLKYHDIPNTVAGACRAAAELGVWMVNVHAAGGPAMMEAAAEAIAPLVDRRPLLVAVTILTSIDQQQFDQIGYQGTIENKVSSFALMAERCGLDGVVCSAMEIEPLRGVTRSGFLLVTPGIRPSGAATGDQKRVMGPQQALERGASHLVVGRPITQAADPAAALSTLIAQMDEPLTSD